MKYTHYFVFSACLVAALGQRPSYAGRNPIGYPTLDSTPASLGSLGNRFGAPPVPTVPLPVEALGDRALVDRVSKLPIDKQPFWYINWRALEQQRRNQQTYEQRQNPFLNDLSSNAQFGNQNGARF